MVGYRLAGLVGSDVLNVFNMAGLVGSDVLNVFNTSLPDDGQWVCPKHVEYFIK